MQDAFVVSKHVSYREQIILLSYFCMLLVVRFVMFVSCRDEPSNVSGWVSIQPRRDRRLCQPV